MKKITLFLFALSVGSLVFGQAAKKVIVEDFTGAWCGYCPRGTTVLEDILNTYPNAIGIANHAGSGTDAMKNSYTTAINTDLNTYGFPGGAVDRFKFSDQSNLCMATNVWKTKTANRLLTTASVAVNIASTYNSTTRLVDVTVTATFVSNASGDMRINCVLIEDGVTGSGSGYNQTNYMGQGCSSPDPSSPWYNYPCSIVGFVHNHVARVNLAPTWGTSGVIPSSVTANSTYSQNYSYTLPSGWDASKMSIVAFVSYYNTSALSRSILNSNEVALGSSTTGIEDNNALPQVQVKQNYPNPFKNITALQFTLNSTDNVDIKIYNAFGQVVNDIVNTKLVPGDHTFYWAGDDNSGNAVAPGVYYYTISTSKDKITKPVVFAGQ